MQLVHRTVIVLPSVVMMNWATYQDVQKADPHLDEAAVPANFLHPCLLVMRTLIQPFESLTQHVVDREWKVQKHLELFQYT